MAKKGLRKISLRGGVSLFLRALTNLDKHQQHINERK